MEIQVAYPHSKETGSPKSLSHKQIWATASAVRRQLQAPSVERNLPLEDLLPKLGRMAVNEARFEVDWDLEHTVLNRAGKPVMGATEYDKASPGCVMVSVNGPKLRNDTVLRSTIAHELGHVVFDAPEWILCAPEQPVQTSFTGRVSWRDPREVRANEFMGALLVPASTLGLDLQRLARQQRLPRSRRPSAVLPNTSAYDDAKLDPDIIVDLIFELAERYGVSESFMRVRLERYDLLRGAAHAIER